MEQRAQAQKMNAYYRLHARIYDATRWSFLFGRRRLLQRLSEVAPATGTVLEVGCGTGYNLAYAARLWPQRPLLGLDISAIMLNKARKKLVKWSNRIFLSQKAYGTEGGAAPAHLILFSYCLTMVNPGWADLLAQATQDLDSNGHVAVVDFHTTPSGWFRRWMAYNHVSFEGAILPYLMSNFEPILIEKKRAYGGLWTYFLFVGRAKTLDQT